MELKHEPDDEFPEKVLSYFHEKTVCVGCGRLDLKKKPISDPWNPYRTRIPAHAWRERRTDL